MHAPVLEAQADPTALAPFARWRAAPETRAGAGAWFVRASHEAPATPPPPVRLTCACEDDEPAPPRLVAMAAAALVAGALFYFGLAILVWEAIR